MKKKKKLEKLFNFLNKKLDVWRCCSIYIHYTTQVGSIQHLTIQTEWNNTSKISNKKEQKKNFHFFALCFAVFSCVPLRNI